MKRMILIADDDQDDQFLMRTAFEEIGLPSLLEFVEDGEMLLNVLKKRLLEGRLPDLILLDLNMPKIDGRNLLKTLKQSGEFCHLPILIFSTSAADAEVKKAYASGAAAYIVKPTDYGSLLKMLRNLTAFYFESAKLPIS